MIDMFIKKNKTGIKERLNIERMKATMEKVAANIDYIAMMTDVELFEHEEADFMPMPEEIEENSDAGDDTSVTMTEATENEQQI